MVDCPPKTIAPVRFDLIVKDISERRAEYAGVYVSPHRLTLPLNWFCALVWGERVGWAAPMPVCPYCSSSDLTRDGHNQGGRVVRACRACGRHASSESASLVSGHRFPRDVIVLAVRYHLWLGAAAERIAGILADRGIDVSGWTVLRWVQKFRPALSREIRRHRQPVGTTWLVDETHVKTLGRWHYLYRDVDEDGQVLDCWFVADQLPGCGRGLLPPHDQLDRVLARTRRHRQSGFLPVSYPLVRTRRQAHGHWLLQHGDLDQ